MRTGIKNLDDDETGMRQRKKKEKKRGKLTYSKYFYASNMVQETHHKL